jgi:hypothetical protein
LGKKIPYSGSLFDVGKVTIWLRPLLGRAREWGGLGWGRVGSTRRKERKNKKIVGQLRIWPDRLRKIRNSLFSNLFRNFKMI